MTRLLALAVLLAGCSAAAPSLRPATQYVLGGQASPDGAIAWLVTAPCDHRPTGWPDARSSCDLTLLTAVEVGPDVYARYNQGDVYTP